MDDDDVHRFNRNLDLIHEKVMKVVEKKKEGQKSDLIDNQCKQRQREFKLQ